MVVVQTEQKKQLSATYQYVSLKKKRKKKKEMSDDIAKCEN